MSVETAILVGLCVGFFIDLDLATFLCVLYGLWLTAGPH